MPRGWSKSGLAHSFLEALLAQPSEPPRNPWVTVTRKRHSGNQPSVVQVKSSTSKGKGKGTSRSPMPKPPPRRGVPESSPEAHERVVRLQAALAAMGDVDCPEAQSLREGLKKAKQAVAPGPVGERLDSCAKFVGRSEKRLQKADEALLKLQEDSATLARELAEGRARLEALRAESSQEIIGPAPQAGEHPGTEEVRKLRELVETLRNQVSSFEIAKEDR